MLTKEQNELLTRVGPKRPMGELMRRYWVPMCLSWELPRPDCPPVRLRVLGEDLVAIRDTGGRVGILSAYCPHRRAHLFWGRNEEYGLACAYHGWKFDLEGNCVDMPSEPEWSNFKDKVKIPAYPAVEMGGVVWGYMGPSGKRPAPPKFEWTQVAESHRGVSRLWQECNWLQALEGGIDTVHINFLHGGLTPARREELKRSDNGMSQAFFRSRAAIVEVVPTDYGYTYAGIRRMSDGENYVRAYHWVMPWHQLRPTQPMNTRLRGGSHIWVPMDDENTMVFNLTYTFGEEPLTQEERALRGSGNETWVDIDPNNDFRSVRNDDNNYLIDRQVQKYATYSGIEGINTQDRAVQESMGRIADRTLERLGTTDRAIIATRRMLLQAVKIVEDGGDPPGVSPSYYKLRPIEKVLPKDVGWFESLRPELYQEAAGAGAQ